MKTIATKMKILRQCSHPYLIKCKRDRYDKIGNTSRTLSFTSSVVSVWWKYCVIPIIKEDKIITDNSKGTGIPISPFSISNTKQLSYIIITSNTLSKVILYNLHLYNSLFIMITSNNYNYSNVVIFIFNLQNPANITRQNMQCRN